uniref:Uncharacterized protein n=1 Tax=Anguilla anguilla TaxID=7936 RepID=A0A0E9QNZ7_ANGAN
MAAPHLRIEHKTLQLQF